VTPAIVVDRVSKRYATRTVVDGVSLAIAPGELVAILGPNGAGKTTTVEMIEGYRRPDAGTILVLGSDPATGGRDLRARVGLMLQEGGIDPRSTPREALVQYGAFHADPRRPDELLALVGLQAVAATRYRRLSGGERQRLGLALALVGRPEVLILDEPIAGMDPEGRATTRGLIAEQRATGVAILLTSHELGEVERLADRVLIVRDGRVIADAAPAALMTTTRPRLRFTLDRALDRDQVADLARRIAQDRPGASLVIDADGRRHVIEGVPPDAGLVAALADWCASRNRLVTELRAAGDTLEETYLALVAADTTEPRAGRDSTR
jgi:ABC-2 type transport system ATP-binding protein